MKKVYVKPVAQAYELEIQGTIAQTSTAGPGYTENPTIKDNDAQTSKRGSWGSLW